jgi:hypothetical protein
LPGVFKKSKFDGGSLPAPALALALLVGFAHLGVLRASELGDGVSKLFESGAKNTPPAVAAAKSQYEKLKRSNPQDRRIDYAYGVVLVNQHKYRDALPLLLRYVETAKPELNAHRVQIWAQIQDRKYADALDGMASLGQRFPHDSASPMEARYLETARFLGTLFGYLELARPGTVNPELKSKSKDFILARLGDPYTTAFDEGRDEVASRASDLQRERKVAQEKASAAAEVRQEQEKAVLEDDRGKITVQQEAMQTSAEQLNEARRELSVIQQQLSSLNADRTRLGAQIVVLQTQLYQIQVDIYNTNNNFGANRPAPNPAPDKNVTGAISVPAAQVEQFARARALTLSLAGLNKQAFNMDRNILAFQQRAAVLSGRGEQEAESLAQRDSTIRNTAKHAKVIEKKLARERTAPPKASTAGLTSQMTSLSTYLPFPYEQEKKRVLEWFENDEK